MKCVVTGGSGFIGSYIVDRLAGEGHFVVIYDIARPMTKLSKNTIFVQGDTKYREILDAVIDGAEEVYDCAGLLGTSELNLMKTRAIETNILGTVNVLESCRVHRVKKIFHPTKPFPGINDILHGRGYEGAWLNTYSVTKMAAEMFCLMYQKENPDMNITVLRWLNGYGGRQHLYPIRKMIPLFVVQALHNRDITVFGSGNQTVDLIYGEDIAKYAIQATRTLGRVPRIMDFGSGLPVSVKDIARYIIDLACSKSKIVNLPMRSGEPKDTQIVADLVPLKTELGVQELELTPLEIGMRTTIEFYKKVPEDEVCKALEHYRIA